MKALAHHLLVPVRWADVATARAVRFAGIFLIRQGVAKSTMRFALYVSFSALLFLIPFRLAPALLWCALLWSSWIGWKDDCGTECAGYAHNEFDWYLMRVRWVPWLAMMFGVDWADFPLLVHFYTWAIPFQPPPSEKRETAWSFAGAFQ